MIRRATGRSVRRAMPRAGAITAALSVGIACAGAAPGAPPAPKDCLNAGCHAALVQPKYVHGPTAVQACGRCHEPTNVENHTFRLVAEAPGLCFSCHVKFQARFQDPTIRPNHHKPVDQGRCLECHDPHASAQPRMLRKNSIVELCMSCHQKTLSLAGEVHEAIKRKNGCIECHRGHDSDNVKLLRKPPAELCVTCHADKYATFTSFAHVHPPVLEKKCIACHTPHASTFGKLLKVELAAGPYVPYDSGAGYALCFQCHDRAFVEVAATRELTNFRNGDRNLHYLHVNKPDKGRSCLICHRPHGSDENRLIRPDMPYGQWDLMIRFTQTATGGYCAPACHSAKRYDRVTPIDMTREPTRPTVPGQWRRALEPGRTSP